MPHPCKYVHTEKCVLNLTLRFCVKPPSSCSCSQLCEFSINLEVSKFADYEAKFLDSKSK